MKEKIAIWEKEIKNTSQAFQGKFADLDKSTLNWKPNPNTWSIAQNIDHLIQISKSYYDTLDKVISGEYKKPFLARIPFLVSFFENFVLKAVQPQNPKKIRTFPVWEPSVSNLELSVLSDFLKEQNQILSYIKRCEHLLDQGIAIPSPASSTIFYSLAGAFEIIVIHQKRHFLQAEAVLKAKGPITSS